MSIFKFTGKDLFILIIRYFFCLLFPPLAVLDKGCGSIILVLLFTLFGWLPGTLLAFLICIRSKNYYQVSKMQDE
jgi:uncharacterized membrane protein YqaE (UPF0057 family)